MPPDAPRGAMTLRAEVAALSLRIEAFRDVDPASVLTVTFQRDGQTLTLTIKPGELHADPVQGLDGVDRAVLRVCDSTPRTPKKIATLAGYSPGRVGESIRKLCDYDPPLLIRVTKGVRKP